MRVALLGAGTATAQRIARDLREQPEVSDVFEVERPDSSIRHCELIVSSTGDLDGDLLGAEIALERGISFISSASDPETIDALLSLGDRARSADINIVAGLGWTNGLSWAMVRAAIEDESEPTDVRVSSAVSGAGEYGAAALEGMANGFARSAGMFQAGGWRLAPSSEIHERVYFPEPLGWRDVWLSSGAEVVLVPRAIPTIEKVLVLSGVAEPAAAGLLAAARKLGPRATSLMVRLASRAASGGPAERSWSAIRVDVTGSKALVSLAILDQLPNLLAAPVVAGVTLFARAGFESPGAGLPESAFSFSDFFAVLAERGVRVARLVR